MGNNNGILLKKVAMFSIHSDPLASLGSQETGGQNIYVRHLAEELTKLGWEVDVFTRWDSLHKKQITLINKRAKVIRLKGGPVKHVPKSTLFDFLPEIFNNFCGFESHNGQYLIFHSHYWDGGAVALMAKEKFKKSIIHNFHSLGITRIETQKKYLKDGTEQDYFSKRLNVENKIIKESAKIICLAQSEKNDLEKLYGCPPEKIHVIPGGVNLKDWPLVDKQKARDHQMIKSEEFVILFVGRFEWRKGLSTLVNALSILKEKIPNLRAIIVGGKIFGHVRDKADLKEYNRIKAMAVDFGIGNLITFTGSVENKALSNFYRASDVFVIPSYYEPFGLVMLEAMANKVPTIASNVGGLASVIKDKKNGLLFEPRNARGLSDKIMEIYKSKDLASLLIQEAYREVSENYSWDKIAMEIAKEYDKLIEINKTTILKT